MFTTKLFFVLISGILLVTEAVPIYESVAADSPQQNVHYRRRYRSSPEAAPEPSEEKVAAEEYAVPKVDGPLMYVMIKPYESSSSGSDKIYMDGVRNGEKGTRGQRLHLADGAYPVFYSIARVNGNFGRSIRALSKAELRNVSSS